MNETGLTTSPEASQTQREGRVRLRSIEAKRCRGELSLVALVVAAVQVTGWIVTATTTFAGQAADEVAAGKDPQATGRLPERVATSGRSAVLVLDGVDGYCEILQAVIPPSGDFTVEVWALSFVPPDGTRRDILSQGPGIRTPGRMSGVFYIGMRRQTREHPGG